MLNKYVVNHGMDRLGFLVYIGIPAGVFFALWWLMSGWKPNMRQVIIMVLIGTCSALSNLGLYSGVPIAPNPSYVPAMNEASISAVTIISVLLGDEWSLSKVAMAALAMFGLVLVVT